MNPELRVLILEDVAEDAELMTRALRKGGLAFVAQRVQMRDAFIHALAEFAPDIVLSDYHLPAFDGRSALAIVRERHPELPVIMVTGAIGDELAVDLLKAGAQDYVLKSRLVQLAPAVLRVLAEQKQSLDRKAAEQASRENELKLRSIGSAAQDAIIMLDNDGRVSYWNPAAEKIFGYGEAEALGLELHAVMVPERYYSAYRKGYDHFRNTGEGPVIGKTLEMMVRRKDGTEFPIELSLSAVILENRWNAIGIVRDISARKQAEEQISRLAAVVEQAGDSVVITDPAGAIAYVNPVFERTSGYSAAEALGHNPRVIKSGHQDELFYRELWQTISAGKTWNGHFVNKRKDGSLYHEDATVFPIHDRAGHIINYAAVKKDVTQRMQAEQHIRKLTLLYATLCYTNEAIVRSTNRTELFENICRSSVEHGKFIMAWIGLVREPTARIDPVCIQGRDDGYLSKLDDATGFPDPTATAIRENRVAWVNDYAAVGESTRCEEELRRGFLGAAALPLRLRSQVIGAVTLYCGETDFFDEDQIHLLEEMTCDIAFALEGFEREKSRMRADEGRKAALKMLQGTLEATIRMAAAAIEKRDPYTAGHQVRVSRLAEAIARELQLSAIQVEGIRFGGLIHDIGKISIPAEILSKPTRLSSLEFSLVRAHAETGFEIVKDIAFPWPIALMILQHHERMDGSGYPMGLRGADIISEARILAVADVVEAMSSHRPYRPSLGIDAALKEIGDFRGTRYDPQAVDACLRLIREQGLEF
jgi:PAS domain S-box-containing protein/putative nucleotidyltransferase with HDIG domain